MTSGIQLHAQAPAAAGADLGFRLASMISGQQMAMRGEELDHFVQALASNRFTLPRNRRLASRITEKGTAIIEVHGILIDRFPFLGQFYGLNSYEGLAEQFRRHATNPDIKRIVLDMDTPGGMVTGIRACAEELIRLAEEKPVFALANNMACSAGYWIGCVAQELSVTPDGCVGSIGVRAAHISYAEALDRDGVSVTMLKAGVTKADLSPYALLDDGAAAETMFDIERSYDRFCDHVATHRPITSDDARATDARTFTGEQAIGEGLADRVETLEELIERVEKSAVKVKPKRKPAVEPGSKAGLAPAERKPDPNRAPGKDDVPSAGKLKGARLMTTQNAAAEEARADLVAAITDALKPMASNGGGQPAKAAEPSVGDQIAAAVDAERTRIFAIVDSDEAKTRSKMAVALAKSGLAADAAKAILAAAPAEVAAEAGSGDKAGLDTALDKQMRREGNSGGIKPEGSGDGKPPRLADRVTAKFKSAAAKKKGF